MTRTQKIDALAEEYRNSFFSSSKPPPDGVGVYSIDEHHKAGILAGIRLRDEELLEEITSEEFTKKLFFGEFDIEKE